MDRQSVFSTHVYDSTFAQGEDTNLQIQAQLEAFILDFRLDNVFVYRDQLRENALLQKYYCDVNIGDLIKFNEEIAHKLVNEPADVIPLVRGSPILSSVIISSNWVISSRLPSRSVHTGSSSRMRQKSTSQTTSSSSIRAPKMSLSGISTLSQSLDWFECPASSSAPLSCRPKRPNYSSNAGTATTNNIYGFPVVSPEPLSPESAAGHV
jgi:hypothetical protein